MEAKLASLHDLFMYILGNLCSVKIFSRCFFWLFIASKLSISKLTGLKQLLHLLTSVWSALGPTSDSSDSSISGHFSGKIQQASQLWAVERLRRLGISLSHLALRASHSP